MKLFLTLLLFISVLGLLSAQNRSIGVRVIDVYERDGVGLSFKQKFHGDMSFEGTVGADGYNQDRGFFKLDFNFIQRPIPIEGLDWYVGLGAQTWFSSSQFVMGPELTLGLDFDFISLPFNLFLDGTYYSPMAGVEEIESVWQIGLGARIFID